MKRSSYFLILVLCNIFAIQLVKAQSVAINNNGTAPDNSSILDVSSRSHGILIPRMDSTERLTIASPAIGLLVYQTNGLNPGFYYYTGISWTRLGSGATNNAYKKAKLAYQVPSGSTAGVAVAGSWATRALNMIKYDDIGIALTSNQISLPPGVYDISAYCVFNNANYAVGYEKIRIQNVSNSTTVAIGLNSAMSVAANYAEYAVSIHDERFALLANSNISLQYLIDAGSFGGEPNSYSGQQEVYAEVIITKVQ